MPNWSVGRWIFMVMIIAPLWLWASTAMYDNFIASETDKVLVIDTKDFDYTKVNLADVPWSHKFTWIMENLHIIIFVFGFYSFPILYLIAMSKIRLRYLW